MATPVNIGVNAPLPAKPWVTEVVQPRVWAVAGPSQDTFVRDAGGAMPTVPLAAPGGAMASGLDPLGDEPLQATLVNGSRLSTVFQANTPFTHLSVALPVALPPFGGAFWAKLLFESSAPTRAWLQDLESQGFTYTAFSEGGRLFVRMSAPNDQAKALPGLITTLLNPHRFQPDEFAQAKAQVLEDLDKKRPPGAQLGIALRQLATGMHHPLFVTPEELAAQLRPATFAQCQQLLASGWQSPDLSEWLSVEPAVAPQGQAAPAESTLLPALNQTISTLSATLPPLASQAKPHYPGGGLRHGQPMLMLRANADAKEGYFQAMIQGPAPTHPDSQAFRVVYRLLKSRTSPFYNVFRHERGLTYSPAVGMITAPNGNWVTLSTDMAYDKLPEAFGALDEVLTRFAQTPVTPEQLHQTKTRILLSLRDAGETAGGLLNLNEIRVAEGRRARTLSRMERTIEGIPLSEVQRVLRTYFAPSQVKMAIGVSAPPEVLQQQFGSATYQGFLGNNPQTNA